MSALLFFKAAAIWLLIAILAIANGAFRESVLIPLLGYDTALPLSGISLSILIVISTYLAFPFFGTQAASVYFLIGVQWVVMTLLFEFGFGHYVMDKSWSSLLQVFNIFAGNLFLLALLTSLLAPLLVAKFKSVI